MAEGLHIILTQQDSSGNLVPNTGATVELIEHSTSTTVKSTDDPPGGITDNGDGTYTIDPSGLSTDKLYDLKVNGVIENEWTEFRIPGLPDILYEDKLDNSTIGIVASKVAVLDDGITKEKIASDVAGAGLVQNADGSLSPDVDDTTIEINDSDKLAVKDGVFASQSDLTDLENTVASIQNDIGTGSGTGTLDFSGTNIVEDSTDLINAIKELDKQVYANYQVLNTPEVNQEQIVYVDATTNASVGGEASSLPEYQETSTTAKTKIRFSFAKTLGDRYLLVKAKCKVSLDGSIGSMRIKIGADYESVTIASTDYQNKEVAINIGTLSSGIHEAEIQLLNDSSETTYMKDVVVIKNPIGY